MLISSTLLERLRGERSFHVFLSFRGPDTRQGFVDTLDFFMKEAGLRVFGCGEGNPVDEEVQREPEEAIKNSLICIPIFSKGYATSERCLRQLTKMTELKKRIIPLFYDVSPEDVALKTPLYAEALEALRIELERRVCSRDDKKLLGEEVQQWKAALKEVGSLEARELKDTGYGEFCKPIVTEVSNVLKLDGKRVTDHVLVTQHLMGMGMDAHIGKRATDYLSGAEAQFEEDLVGMDVHIEPMLNLLDVESHDVRYVGIYGVGGVGKTTLANAIFNQLSPHFQLCSFLADTQDSVQQNGIVYLQKQLLNDLECFSRDITDSDEGIKMIMATCRNKRVLIVLDDVNCKEQIDKLAGDSNWFGLGSRIIVTSRDDSILASEGHGSKQCEGVSIFEMQEMNFDHALRLFCRQAFGKDSPAPGYDDLAREAVPVCGFLPLSLEVIGSLFGRERKDCWDKMIRTLRMISPEKVKQKLMMSYRALNSHTQQMFLDVACFLMNKGKTNATYLWEACEFDPKTGLEELVSMSLVKIVNRKLWMHDYAKDLGRDIVVMEKSKHGRCRSRHWKVKEVLSILDEKEGTENVEALCMFNQGLAFGSSMFNLEELHMCMPNHGSGTKSGRGSRRVSLSGSFHFRDLRFSKLLSPVIGWISSQSAGHEFTENNFKNFKNLRFLELWPTREGCGFNLTGNFAGLFQNLRWLSWHDCPSHLKAKNLNFVSLVVLDLSYSTSIATDWKGWSKIKIGNALKVLDLSHCCSLKRLPSLSKFSTLEKLVLEGCAELMEIGSSIKKVRILKHLNLRGCSSLQGLPEELCSLEKLEEILVRANSNSFTLPRGIGNLKSLANLDLAGTGISELPTSVSQLKNLECLSLRGCPRMCKLPDALGDLTSLVGLDISHTWIGDLPESIGGLRGLKVLKINGCPIRKLPNSIRLLENLEEFHANELFRKELVAKFKPPFRFYADTQWIYG